MAKVQLTVCIGRAVVQDEFGFADVFVGNALIDIQLLPAREHFGLALAFIGNSVKGKLSVCLRLTVSLEFSFVMILASSLCRVSAAA